MKEKLTRNIGLKVLSIILATLLWVVIANTDDPVIPKSFRDVPVEVLNEDVIASLKQVYEISEGETIDFTVEARRSIIDYLSEDDFKITADFKHLSDVDAVPISITCPEDDVEITEGKFQTMIISRQVLLKKDFKVNIVENGEVAEGYYIGEASASPNIIQVSGPKVRVERISEVVVEVDVTGATKSFKTNAVPQVLDSEGNPIDPTKLTFSSDEVEVNIGLLNTKKITLMISTTGDPAIGYEQTKVEYEPKEIMVAGEEEDLKNLSYLSIKEDITGATENIEKEIDLQERLDDGIILVGEDQTAVVNITIEKLETKEITILPEDIEVRNKAGNLTLQYNNNGGIILKLMGRRENLNGINRYKIDSYIDLTDLTIGTYTIPINCVLPNKITMSGYPTINVGLLK